MRDLSMVQTYPLGHRSGVANLPLHGGKAPSWLTVRMRKLAKEIADIVIEEYGTATLVQRLSDPFWFQALGCVLAYDWHSSGVTTVVTGILKGAISPEEHGIAVCGGKAKRRRKHHLTSLWRDRSSVSQKKQSNRSPTQVKWLQKLTTQQFKLDTNCITTLSSLLRIKNGQLFSRV